MLSFQSQRAAYSILKQLGLEQIGPSTPSKTSQRRNTTGRIGYVMGELHRELRVALLGVVRVCGVVAENPECAEHRRGTCEAPPVSLHAVGQAFPP